MEYRVFINKSCDRSVFGPLYSRSKSNRKVGTDEHDFFSGTLEELTGSPDYEREQLLNSEMNGQELFDYIYMRIGTDNYMGAIETTKYQAELIQYYCDTIAPPGNP